MKAVLPLDQMSIAEKLSAMEQLWEDLSRNADRVPSPAWHADVLAARERRAHEGKAKFVSLDQMKSRVRKATR